MRSVLYITLQEIESREACYILQIIAQPNYYKYYMFMNHNNTHATLKTNLWVLSRGSAL